MEYLSMFLFESTDVDQCSDQSLRPKKFISFIAFKGFPISQQGQGIVFLICSMGIIMLSIYLANRSTQRIIECKKRDPAILDPEHDTYCITTLYILHVSRI